MKAQNWKDLPVAKQTEYLEQFDMDSLVKSFGNTAEFYNKEKEFWESLPSLEDGKEIEHPPTKDLVESARRDLSFFEANFELIDNAIDSWRRNGKRKELEVHINFDLDLGRGTFEDNAGGMDQRDVYKVFIPGETSNRDYKQATIGSFGMGAKKGIFRLSDGATIISARDPKTAYYSMVPEGWEKHPNWTTRDGDMSAKGQIEAGCTRIAFHKLFAAPTLSDLDQLRVRIGATYKVLIEGIDPWAKGGKSPLVKIWVNNTLADPEKEIEWSGPSGVEPRRYRFSIFLENFLNTGNDFTLKCAFDAGLLRKQAPSDKDWGIDVIANGRVIQKYLKRQFQIGTTGLSSTTGAHKLFRGVLHIYGHSFAIPWDTHKREYLLDHPVSILIGKTLRPIIKSYFEQVRAITDQEQGTRNYLMPSVWEPEKAKAEYDIGTVKQTVRRTTIPDIAKDALPLCTIKFPSQISKSKGKVTWDIDLEFSTSQEVEFLKRRFDVSTADEAAEAIRRAVLRDIIISLTDDQFSKVCRKLSVENAIEISDKLRKRLSDIVGA